MADALKRQQRTERLDVLDTGLGKVYIERRNGAPKLYARAHIQGGYAPLFNTGKTTVAEARAEAGKWFQRLYQQAQVQKLHGHKFTVVAEAALKWLDDTKQGELSPGQIKNQHQKWSVLSGKEAHEPLPPWVTLFDKLNVEDVDYTWLVKFRDVRKAAVNKRGEPITNATLRKDMLFFKLVLHYALEVEHIIDKLPAFPEWRGTFTVKKNPTPYLNIDDYMKLLAIAKKRMREPDLNPRVRRQREELMMFIMISVCAALRVGEAEGITWADCEKGTMKSGGEVLDCVRMWVFGKHGKRTNEREKAIGLYHAVEAFDFLKAARPNAKSGAKLFEESHDDGLTDLLKEAELWEVKREDGSKAYRNAKSFRHTGISLWIRFAKNPNLDDIAVWARTKRVHIEDFYDQNPVETAVRNIAALRRPKTVIS